MTWISAKDPPYRAGPYLVEIDCPRGKWVEVNVFQMQDGWESTTQENTDTTAYVKYWMKLPKLPRKMVENELVD